METEDLIAKRGRDQVSKGWFRGGKKKKKKRETDREGPICNDQLNKGCSCLCVCVCVLTGGELLCNVVLVSAAHQCESAEGIHKSPPS